MLQFLIILLGLVAVMIKDINRRKGSLPDSVKIRRMKHASNEDRPNFVDDSILDTWIEHCVATTGFSRDELKHRAIFTGYDEMVYDF